MPSECLPRVGLAVCGVVASTIGYLWVGEWVGNNHVGVGAKNDNSNSEVCCVCLHCTNPEAGFGPAGVRSTTRGQLFLEKKETKRYAPAPPFLRLPLPFFFSLPPSSPPPSSPSLPDSPSWSMLIYFHSNHLNLGNS